MKRSIWQRRLLGAVLTFIFVGGSWLVAAAQTSPRNEETIVMIRHGEKPVAGLGQLNCKGLNRALALPALLIGRYGKPDFLYAPNPAVEVRDGHAKPTYSYVRPLATIEPTAIRLGMPVNTQIGYDKVGALEKALLQPAYAHSLIFVVWEHDNMHLFAEQMLDKYGDGASKLADWPAGDYGTIYVFHFTRAADGGKPHVTLEIQKENLGNTLKDTCPGADSIMR